jgi:large subunit ribosomal protein L30
MTIQKEQKTVTVELIRSVIGTKKSHRETLIGLGLRAKINAKSTVVDTPSVRGMINKVHYLIKVIGE